MLNEVYIDTALHLKMTNDGGVSVLCDRVRRHSTIPGSRLSWADDGGVSVLCDRVRRHSVPLEDDPTGQQGHSRDAAGGRLDGY